MSWAPARNAAPATSAMIIANLAKGEAELRALEDEGREIEEALPGLVAEPDRYVEAENRLREIGVLVPSKRCTIAAIREAIPVAEERERREVIQAQVDEQARQSAKLQRGLEARYTKAAEAFAEVCREIQADADNWRQLRARADTVKPRVPTPHDTAEMSLRYAKFASPNYGLKSVTEDLTVRAWDGSVLFQS